MNNSILAFGFYVMFVNMPGCNLEGVMEELSGSERDSKTGMVVSGIHPPLAESYPACGPEVEARAEISQNLYRIYASAMEDGVVTESEAGRMYEDYAEAHIRYESLHRERCP